MILMKRARRRFAWLAVVPLLSALAFPVGPGKTEAFTSANATAAMNSFLNSFYDSSQQYFYTNSDHQIHAHASGPQNGLYTDYWWEAQLWQTVMDAYERTGSQTYYDLIGDIYDGFRNAYPDWSANPFNDDIGWWALGALRAYDITGDTRYKTVAKDMFDHLWQSWSSDFGGGIWWNTIGHEPQKNVATNATAAEIAMKLYRVYNDSSYLTKAEQLYDWVEDTLYAGDGYVYDQYRQGEGLKDWEFTYNFGMFAGASLAMYEETNDSHYLQNATDSVDWVIDHMTADGSSLLYEGEDDTALFKMIFARNVRNLIDGANQTQYESFLAFNASQAWNHRRAADGLIGPDWTMTPGGGFIQSSAAGAGVSILFLANPDGGSGTVVGPGPYEAENALRTGVPNEQNAYENAGYSGRGYVAGWNANDTYVTFPVNVLAAGSYDLTFRYSAGAGNASRELKVNGTTVQAALAFAGTGNWTTWNTVTVGVPLSAGTNLVRLAFENASGSSNYLNLDRLTVQQNQTYEAEAGTLHGLGTEATYAGYTGTGYVAGWNGDGQWVDFAVQADRDGLYTLTFRYAAGAGAASRYLYVNGASVAANLAFAGTASWSSYATVTVGNVPLHAGGNTVSLIYDSSKGSANYLNLDNLKVTS
jgi:predicted alpha-1,6-mannanase (GH76 family)